MIKRVSGFIPPVLVSTPQFDRIMAGLWHRATFFISLVPFLLTLVAFFCFYQNVLKNLRKIVHSLKVLVQFNLCFLFDSFSPTTQFLTMLMILQLIKHFEGCETIKIVFVFF